MIEKMNILLINKEDNIQQMLIETIRRWRSNFIAVTGIGLSVVNKMIQMYCGRIWLEPEFCSGSTFFFTLPKKRSLN